MRYLSDTLNRILSGLGLELEPWMAPLVAVVIALGVLPFYYRNFRTKRARKRVQAAANADLGERRRLEDEALDLVSGNPFGLMVVAEEADKRGLRKLALRALGALEATGKRRTEARLLRAKLAPDMPTTADGEALAVEKLREAGLHEQAEERLRRARQRFGDHPALRDQ